MGRKKGVDYIGKNVVEAGKDRMKKIYKQFDKVYVSFSGGKDSLVVLKLFEEVLNEMGKEDEKINVIFRDEELIADNVINFVQKKMENDRYNFKYYAVQMKSNKYILGKTYEYIQWDNDREWIRDKPEFAITRDGLFDQYSMDKLQCEGDKGRVCFMTGIRTDESLVRYASVVGKKDESYIAKSSTPKAKLGRPIYDWSEADIFKYIYDNDIEYCETYDLQYWNDESLRVSTPLHSESAKHFEKVKTRTPQFYKQLIQLFPEMKKQEKYFDDLDRFGVIWDYKPTIPSIINFIKNEIDESQQQLALKRIKQALRTRINKMKEGQTENYGGYPFRYLYRKLVNGSFKRAIGPQPKPTKKDIKFENK